MPDRMKISEQITVGAQPSEAELKAMSQDGIASIINLRTDGEDMQPISPQAEADLARQYEMQYQSLPVSMSDADASLVDQFRKTLADAKKPVFVHCKLGKRAGAFVMMHQAVEAGWSGEQTLKKAEEMGFECDNEKLESFVKDYVDQKAGKG